MSISKNRKKRQPETVSNQPSEPLTGQGSAEEQESAENIHRILENEAGYDATVAGILEHEKEADEEIARILERENRK